MRFELSQEEEKSLEPIMTALSDRAGHRITLAYLLDRWFWFVGAVEQGYDDSIYEYTNDLSVRDLLESVIDACPAPLGNRLMDRLGEWDGRFLKATAPWPKPLLTQEGSEEPSWWWVRVPVRLGTELEKDLKEIAPAPFLNSQQGALPE